MSVSTTVTTRLAVQGTVPVVTMFWPITLEASSGLLFTSPTCSKPSCSPCASFMSDTIAKHQVLTSSKLGRQSLFADSIHTCGPLRHVCSFPESASFSVTLGEMDLTPSEVDFAICIQMSLDDDVFKDLAASDTKSSSSSEDAYVAFNYYYFASVDGSMRTFPGRVSKLLP